jgi:hypothetical protein
MLPRRSTLLCAALLVVLHPVHDAVGQIWCGADADYPLDGNAIDVSGNGNTGTVSGPIPTTDRFGTPDHAMWFDGVDDRIELPDDFDLPLRTWTMWFKADVIDGSVHEIMDDDHPGSSTPRPRSSCARTPGSRTFIMASALRRTGSPIRWRRASGTPSRWSVTAPKCGSYLNGCLVHTGTDMANDHSLNGLSPPGWAPAGPTTITGMKAASMR